VPNRAQEENLSMHQEILVHNTAWEQLIAVLVFFSMFLSWTVDEQGNVSLLLESSSAFAIILEST